MAVVVAVVIMVGTIVFIASTSHSGSPSPVEVTTVKVGLQPWDLLYNPSNNYVYVANVQSCPVSGDLISCNAPGTISVISGTKVVANITVGTAPVELSYDSLDHYVYEIDSTNAITVISGTQVVGTVTVPEYPSSMLYDPSDGYLYVSIFNPHTGEGVVSVISGTSLLGTVEGVGYSSAMGYDPSNHYVYIASENAVYLVSGLKVVAQLASSVNNAQQVLYDPVNGYVYAANFGKPSVTILDNATLIGNATMPEASTPNALAYDPQNNYVYVTNFATNTVAAISGTAVIATIAVGNVPDSVFYNPLTQEIYVTYNYSGDNMSVISGTSLVGNLTLGRGPISPVYNPSDNEVYIADSGSNEVSVLAYAAAESSSVSSSSSSAASTTLSPNPGGSTTTVNGAPYHVDNVTGDSVAQNPGYAYFRNGSVTFMGVRFATICPPVYAGCPVPPGTTYATQTELFAGAIRMNVTFPDATNETIGGVIGDTTYYFVFSQHTSPRAGVLVTYTGTGYQSYLLVS